MRKLELLILASRRATENQEFTDTAGIQDDEFIQYFNDGQEEIHAIINQAFPRILMKQKTISLTQNQEGYSIPSDCYLGTRVDFVEYTPNGSPDSYYPLKKGSLKERLNGSQANPSFYIRSGSQLLLQPVPQSSNAQIRVTYQRAIPKLDTIRATVESVTLGTGTITSLVLDDSVLMDTAALLEEGYVTIVDKDGQVKMQSIPVTAISSSGVVTVGAGFQFEAGETIAAGDFVCRGKFSSHFSQLPDICEKFLLEYANTRILIRDSSTDSGTVGQVMLKIQGSIQTAFAEPDNDPDYIPVLDGQYLGWDSF